MSYAFVHSSNIVIRCPQIVKIATRCSILSGAAAALTARHSYTRAGGVFIVHASICV